MADWKELFTGTDLSGWSGRDGAEHTWGVAGDVALDETDPALFTVKPGTGVFYNGATGRTADLISTISHGDCEMHIEFVVPKGSNSGVYVMGRYEIQVFDSQHFPVIGVVPGCCETILFQPSKPNGFIEVRHRHDLRIWGIQIPQNILVANGAKTDETHA